MAQYHAMQDMVFLFHSVVHDLEPTTEFGCDSCINEFWQLLQGR
jgi:hypothetical protein